MSNVLIGRDIHCGVITLTYHALFRRSRDSVVMGHDLLHTLHATQSVLDVLTSKFRRHVSITSEYVKMRFVGKRNFDSVKSTYKFHVHSRRVSRHFHLWVSRRVFMSCFAVWFHRES